MFDYTITNKTLNQLQKDLSGVDIIHVNGGNSFYLLLQIRKSGFRKFVHEHVDKGKVYIGSSAGSIVAAPDIEITKRIETGKYIKILKTHKALGLVDFIILPHWGSDYFKDMYLKSRLEITYKPENKIILLNDYQYVKVEDDMYKIVDVRNR